MQITLCMSYISKWITQGILIHCKRNRFLSTVKKYYFQESTGLYKTISTYIHKSTKQKKKKISMLEDKKEKAMW